MAEAQLRRTEPNAGFRGGRGSTFLVTLVMAACLQAATIWGFLHWRETLTGVGAGDFTLEAVRLATLFLWCVAASWTFTRGRSGGRRAVAMAAIALHLPWTLVAMGPAIAGAWLGLMALASLALVASLAPRRPILAACAAPYAIWLGVEALIGTRFGF